MEVEEKLTEEDIDLIVELVEYKVENSEIALKKVESFINGDLSALPEQLKEEGELVLHLSKLIPGVMEKVMEKYRLEELPKIQAKLTKYKNILTKLYVLKLEGVDEEIKELQHYRDRTVGLWATDRPDLIQDPKGIMFRLGE